MTQLNTLSRSSQRPSETARPDRPRTASGSEPTVMPTSLAACPSRGLVDFLQLARGGLDDVLGRGAGARLGEHVDDDILGDVLGECAARRRGPTRPVPGPQRLSV